MRTELRTRIRVVSSVPEADFEMGSIGPRGWVRRSVKDRGVVGEAEPRHCVDDEMCEGTCASIEPLVEELGL